MTSPAPARSVEVIDPGVLTTVQDRGRTGLAHIGVPHGGAVDPRLAALCNRLVGNPPDAALLESVGPLRIRADAPITVASDVEPAPRSVRPGEVVHVDAGGRQWHYLAVRGGIDVAPVLGSRSTDTLSGLGPPPARAGDRLPIGPEPSGPLTADVAPLRQAEAVAHVSTGPRADWFAPGSLGVLRSATWTIGAASRVGVRLSGGPIERVRNDELPSEGLVRGAIQVPPDGDPIMMLADHPTTGGYPVIAVVDPDDVATVAQLLPGAAIRFR